MPSSFRDTIVRTAQQLSSPPMSPKTRSDRFLPMVARPWLMVWLLAFVVRAAYLWQIRDSDLAAALFGDASVYDAWAQRIAAGEWLGTKVFYQAPLYPYFIGVIYALGDHHLILVRVVQIVIGAFSCVCLGKAAEHFVSRRAGFVAGVLMAVCPSIVFFDALIQKAVLDVFLFALVWMLAAIAAEKKSVGRWWLALGVAIGLLALTRENALVITPLFILWAWQHSRVRAVSFVLVGLAAVLMPVSLRNKIVGGEFHLTTSQMGPNFFIGNNPLADGTYTPLLPRRGDAVYEQQDANNLAERVLGKKLSAAEVSDFWMGRSLTFIREQPVRWLKLMARKWWLVWNAAELGDTEEQSAYEASSSVLRMLSLFLHFGVLCPLAMAGVVWSWHRRRALWILHATALTYALSVAAFYVFARYRLPLYLVVIVFTAVALIELGKIMCRPVSRNGWLGIFAAALTAICVNWPVSPQNVDGALTFQNLGFYFSNQRQFDRALEYFDKALKRFPDSPSSHAGKGLALFELHRTDESIMHLETALRLHPEFPTADNNLGNAYLAKNQPAEAIAHYERALRLRPDEAAMHYNLGNALLQMGRESEAIAHYETTLTLQPDFADAHNNLGSLLFQKGNTDAAVTHFQRYAELRPDAAGAHANLGVVLRQLGRHDAALKENERAIELDPNQTAALGNLAWMLSTSKNENVRNGPRALLLASKADELSNHRNPGVVRILAAAFAENGKFSEAEQIATSAIDIAIAQGDRAFANIVKNERDLYRERQPVRE